MEDILKLEELKWWKDTSKVNADSNTHIALSHILKKLLPSTRLLRQLLNQLVYVAWPSLMIFGLRRWTPSTWVFVFRAQIDGDQSLEWEAVRLYIPTQKATIIIWSKMLSMARLILYWTYVTIDFMVTLLGLQYQTMQRWRCRVHRRDVSYCAHLNIGRLTRRSNRIDKLKY